MRAEGGAQKIKPRYHTNIVVDVALHILDNHPIRKRSQMEDTGCSIVGGSFNERESEVEMARETVRAPGLRKSISFCSDTAAAIEQDLRNKAGPSEGRRCDD